LAQDRGATCQLRRPTPSQRRVSRVAHAGARCVLTGGAALELAARARRAALVAVSPYLAEKCCVDETPLPLSARPRCDVPAAVSDAKPAPRVSRGARSRYSLSLGRRRSTRPCCARAPCCAGLGLPTPYQRALRRREASPFRRATVVRHASCDLQRQASAACHAAQARQRSLSLGRRGAALELASRARRAVMVVEGSRLVEVRRTGERTLFSDAAPWCDVPAAASSFKPEPRVSRGTSASALAVSRRKRSIRACLACAWCRDGYGRPSPFQRTLRRRDSPPLWRATVVRRASCSLQLHASAAWLARRWRVGARCVWEGGAALDLAAHAPCCAGLGRRSLY